MMSAVVDRLCYDKFANRFTFMQNEVTQSPSTLGTELASPKFLTSTDSAVAAVLDLIAINNAL